MYISCQNSQMMTTDINRRNKFMFKSGVCKNKSKEQMIRKIIELAFIGLMVFVIIYYPQVAAFADDGEAAVSGAQLVSNSVGKVYDIIHFLRREMLNFTAFPVFFVSNLLLVQRKKYYFNRATVSRNCSIVL